ncbi:hypothetical protein K438DRAFT_2117929, partial [Mycena galopus ATCC 62051]
LGIPPLAGHTLVNYAGSLTGRDFRVIVQAAPFVLQGLLPANHLALWTSLSAVVTLVWQPHIDDIEKYIVDLDAAIKHFLDCTCKITFQWFNKPKFHVILHLPEHIRRFGPAMLFATEGFESFNAIIRSCSVHSNRHAPSLDIASRMAKGNRVRHLLSRGFFPSNNKFKSPDHRSSRSPWMDISYTDFQQCNWSQAGTAPLHLIELNSFVSRLLGGWEPPISTELPAGECIGPGLAKLWSSTKCASVGIQLPISTTFTPKSVKLINGDICGAGDWVVWDEFIEPMRTNYTRIGCVVEIIKAVGSQARRDGTANFVLLSRAIIGDAHDLYKMRHLQPIPNEYKCVEIRDIKCTVNIQHNCADNKCRSTRTKAIFNEREQISDRALAVEHVSPSDLIINTGQMRDAASLNSLRWVPDALVTSQVIKDAAETAYINRQKQKNSADPEVAEAETDSLHNSEPARKRTKSAPLRGRSSLRGGPGPSNLRASALPLSAVLSSGSSEAAGPFALPTQPFSFLNTFQSNFNPSE